MVGASPQRLVHDGRLSPWIQAPACKHRSRVCLGGSELRRPLGVAIAGGLIFSQILTLYTTPIIYLYFDQISNYFQRRHPGSLPTPPPLGGD